MWKNKKISKKKINMGEIKWFFNYKDGLTFCVGTCGSDLCILIKWFRV